LWVSRSSAESSTRATPPTVTPSSNKRPDARSSAGPSRMLKRAAHWPPRPRWRHPGLAREQRRHRMSERAQKGAGHTPLCGTSGTCLRHMSRSVPLTSGADGTRRDKCPAQLESVDCLAASRQRAASLRNVSRGLTRAKSEGKRLGPPGIAPELEERIRKALATPGRPGVRKIAERFGVDPGTVQRISRPRPFADGAASVVV
jgi:hypothetical protein